QGRVKPRGSTPPSSATFWERSRVGICGRLKPCVFCGFESHRSYQILKLQRSLVVLRLDSLSYVRDGLKLRFERGKLRAKPAPAGASRRGTRVRSCEFIEKSKIFRL